MPNYNHSLKLKSAARLGLLATAIAVSLCAQAEEITPADTYVQQYTGDYPLAVTESVGTYSEAETAEYPEAMTYPTDGEMTPGYETAASENNEPLDAIYTENVRDEAIVTVPASYSTDGDIPIFINDNVSTSAALDDSVIQDRDAPEGYYAQFGAFGQLGNALRLRSKLSSELGTGVVVVEEGGLYKVQAGPLETSDRAFSMQTSSEDKIRVIRR